MATIAVYSPKGGVGKTTLAVNLAWAAASLSARRTLLWDLDAQGAASWLLGHDGQGAAVLGAFGRDADPRRFVRATAFERLDLLPADPSLRGLDRLFHDLAKKKRLRHLAEALAHDRDRIVIDCPPGLTDTTDQILRAADLVVVPVIPAPLSRRALDLIAGHVRARKGPRVVLAPVFSMVDRRRALHRAQLAEHPAWPAIPMASAVERMTDLRLPLGAYAPRSPAMEAVTALWRRIERELAV